MNVYWFCSNGFTLLVLLILVQVSLSYFLSATFLLIFLINNLTAEQSTLLKTEGKTFATLLLLEATFCAPSCL